MRKQEKILSFFLMFSLVLVFYLVLTSRSLTYKGISDKADNISINKGEVVKVDHAELANKYRKDTQGLFSKYEKMLTLDELKPEQIAEIKEQLLNLVVPGEYKDLHISLFFALVNMEDYFVEGEGEYIKNSQSMISEIKEKYVWLN